ncbi:hypothetical protein Bp8pS_238 [Bacillus phage vB_BpuM-BpSp]|nr:hypothetical protein Bp8pS_238 [Bacillus phage vB_BpuM-BpSp]
MALEGDNMFLEFIYHFGENILHNGGHCDEADVLNIILKSYNVSTKILDDNYEYIFPQHLETISKYQKLDEEFIKKLIPNYVNKILEGNKKTFLSKEFIKNNINYFDVDKLVDSGGFTLTELADLYSMSLEFFIWNNLSTVIDYEVLSDLEKKKFIELFKEEEKEELLYYPTIYFLSTHSISEDILFEYMDFFKSSNTFIQKVITNPKNSQEVKTKLNLHIL